MVRVWVAVNLCDPLDTHGSYLSALEVRHDEALFKSTFTLLYFTIRYIKYYDVYTTQALAAHLVCGCTATVHVPYGINS